MPLRRTVAEADTAHDPRRSIEARYKNYDEYHALFLKALNGLIRDGYILAEDRESVDRSKVEWDWILQDSSKKP